MTTIIPRPTTLLAPQLDYILVDGSGSMMSQWHETLAAIDTYVDVLKAANANAQLILTVFDSTDISCTQRNHRLDTWTPLRHEPIGSHFNGTPLYDAINVMARTLRDLNPPNAHIVIVTDGADTHSVTSITQAKAVLDWCRAKGWQVTFIGANFNNLQQAALLGSHPESCIGVEKSQLSPAAKALGTKRLRHIKTGAGIHFDDGEKQQFGGYLNG